LFGIDVDEVSLQEVRLPQDIHQQCVEACKATYLPLIAQKEAMGRKMELQAEADVIGAATVGAKEVASVAPAYTLSDFLTRFIGNNAAMTGAAAAQAAALLPQQPPPQPLPQHPQQPQQLPQQPQPLQQQPAQQQSQPPQQQPPQPPQQAS
jgi:hypothetical protein